MTEQATIQPDLLAAALAYASNGLPVFPCHPETKRPLTERGFKEASSDPEQVRAWWSKWPRAMIGLPTGQVSGAWVLDIDDPAAFEAACTVELPATKRCTTGKGYHLYFAYDPSDPIRNAQFNSRTGWPFPELPGAEVRGDGGYVIVPPSRHPSGRLYAWECEGEPKQAPAALRKLLKKTERSAEKSRQDCRSANGQDTAYGLRALEDECAKVRSAPDGGQECALNEAALKVGQLVAGGELSASTARGRLLAAGLGMPSYNPRDPWTTDAVVSKVERGLVDGAGTPRRAPERDGYDRRRSEQPPHGHDNKQERRERQRQENREIGEGTREIPTAKILSLEDMLRDYVLILQGSLVAPLSMPQAVLALPDFKNAMAGSKHWVRPENEKPKARPVVNCWLEHQERKEAETITFRAGGETIVPAPSSNRPALNMWAPFTRAQPPADWRARAAIFVDHINWLWGADAEEFLDWLAHIEQHPGVLPHYGWVHISRQHGKGRNWISSVLARVWRGYVAASLDLVAMLEGKFNGRLSRKILAIVDEINEGGNATYRHAQALRQMVTVEHREINPKYGKQHVEYNSCRWLLFSNHVGAIPLTEDDRRFWVVSHDGEPKDQEYYARLYSALPDPAFVASVTEFLRRRDVSHFKPGQRPPMSEAKRALISVGQNEDYITLSEIATKWPVDIITNWEITALLEGSSQVTAAIRRALSDLDFRRIETRVRVDGQGSQRAYSIRNHSHWSAAKHDALAAEIRRAHQKDKEDAIGRGIIAPQTGTPANG
ncbi:bifunctional DNA primase/polymerase [Novosphingobium olei]|uniref:bifunctional DNA primase/polymerase n=1 Tax=Novosphingobium olei TaxID=2728851 RepID=UPI00308F80A4|nr:hypothetical protein NSDW_10710 [Novosphingobium olei]